MALTEFPIPTTQVSAAVHALMIAANQAAMRTAVGLGQVNDTSDANKPVSTATQTQLDLKAPLASPSFTTQITTPKITFTGSVIEVFGTGSPEGVVTAAVGSVFHRTDGGATTALYFKGTGSGNTGWVALGASATVAWGSITGTLSSQTDLQSALNTKVPYLTGLDPTGVANASAVIQAALDSLTVTGGVIYLPVGTFKIGTAITLYYNTRILGSGIDATILKASANIVMFSGLDVTTNGVAAYGLGLDNLTVDGNSTGATGLKLQRFYAGQIHRTRFRQCAIGLHLHGAPIWDVIGCHFTENVTGILGDVHNNGSDNWGSNLVQIYGGRHESNTGWLFDMDSCGMWNLYSVNPEFNGTNADDNTGVIRCSNANYKETINLFGCWFERNLGFAALAFYTPQITDARASWTGGLSDFNSSLKHGIYLGASASNRHRIVTQGVQFASHAVSDITLADARCIWERGPTTTGGTLNTSAGIVYSWGEIIAGNTSAGTSVGYINVPQNSRSAAYTTVLEDQGKHIFHPSADTTARTFTIDSNANVAYPIGTAITFVNQNSGGVITIAITSDTMRLAGAGSTGSRTLAANGIATALKVATTEWLISGTGLT